MLTRLIIKRGEGLLVRSSKFGSRGRRESLPQSPTSIIPQVEFETQVSMSHEGEPTNMKKDEKVFRNSFFDMKTMVKVLYEERSTRL